MSALCWNMLKKVGAKAQVSRDPEVLRQADKLVLPGVGAFDEAMGNLHRFGLSDVLNEVVLEKHKPILRCVPWGATFMTCSSEEGLQPGLGWLNARIVRFSAQRGNNCTYRTWAGIQ